jgi:hypothetical protein
MDGVLPQFSSNQYLQGSKEFLQSNSIVAKFAFLILVLIAFMVLINFGTLILSKIFSHDNNPILIKGMVNSKQMMIVPQDPSKKGAVPILRSNNEREGIEFTWSVWIFIDDFKYKENEYKHVFHKGNDNVIMNDDGEVPAGINFPNNGPGLYITPRIRNRAKGDVAGLSIIMNSFNDIMEEIEVRNIPLNKWVNVIIRVTKQNQVDVYITGALVKRHMLQGVPKQNYGDVYVSMNGGFSGNTSELRYFDKAIGTRQIQNIVSKGPNKKLVGSNTSSTSKGTNKYLSTRWYLESAMDV